MPGSLEFDATQTPADLIAGAGLSIGATYTAQNLSLTADVLVRSAATAPDPDDRAFRVSPGGSFAIRPDGTPVWCWTESGTVPLLLDVAA